MKSTYSVVIVVSFGWKQGIYQVQLTFPACVDMDMLEEAIEVIESYENMPERAVLEAAFEEFDDEPDISIKRCYNLSPSDFGRIVHERYEDDEEMFEEAQDSVQSSFCRNCGAEGQSLEPDAYKCTCGACGQDALQSLAVCLGIL